MGKTNQLPVGVGHAMTCNAHNFQSLPLTNEAVKTHHPHISLRLQAFVIHSSSISLIRLRPDNIISSIDLKLLQAMAAKPTSCFTFLKEAVALPTRNPKLFAPILIILAAVAFLVPAFNVVAVQPLTAEMTGHLVDMQNTDPSSAEYARLLQEIRQEARELILIAIGLTVISLALGFAKQIVAFFAASTTYSGDRLSLPEILRRLTKWENLRGPLVTMAVVTALQLASMALLGAYLATVMRRSGMVSLQGALFALAFLAFMTYFGVVATVGVAASVADEGCRGVRALRRAWRLLTRVERKEGAVLAAAMVVLPTVVSPVYGLAMVCAKKSVAAGLWLLSVHALLSGAVELFYLAAATVYCCQAMESKGVVQAFDGYAKLPSGEAYV